MDMSIRYYREGWTRQTHRYDPTNLHSSLLLAIPPGIIQWDEVEQYGVRITLPYRDGVEISPIIIPNEFNIVQTTHRPFHRVHFHECCVKENRKKMLSDDEFHVANKSNAPSFIGRLLADFALYTPPPDIRSQQRNGRKCITTVAGIPKQFSLNKILKYFKKVRAIKANPINLY